MADGENLITTASAVGDRSLLLEGLADSFRNILRLELDRDAVKEEKEKQKKAKAKKKNKSAKDEDKPKKEIEDKQVTREGDNSFITHPTASSFAVFSHVRHLVLQQQLCDTYNYRNRDMSGGDQESSGEEEEEEEERIVKLPEVVTLGIRGVFAILRDVWQQVPQLCVKVLEEFLNILQGQMPAGLKKEPSETTTALFDLLVKMVSEPVACDDPKVSCELVSLASSCLLSLVIALGETDKLLAAISALLIAPPDIANSSLKVPTILRSLQVSVQAILLGSFSEADWIQKGVLEKSLIDSWPLGQPVANDDGPAAAIATDSSYLYVHGPFGLMKVGLGYGSTVKGKVYERVADFHNTESGRLMFVSGKLLYYSTDSQVIILDTETLKIEQNMELDVDAMGPMCLFSDGKDLQQIMATKEGGFSLRKLTTICTPIPVVEQKPLDLTQKSVLSLGKSKYNPQGSLYTLYQNNSLETKSIVSSKNFSAVLTSCGQLFYQGNGSALGITDKDIPKGEWKKVDLPDSQVTITDLKMDHTGSYCMAISSQGVIYFGGINRKGEAAENPPAGRQPPKPMKFKKITKLKDKEVTGCACGTHLSAIVDKEGKMYLFGQLEEDLVDKQTGVVTGLLGVPVTQVAMGRSHICVLTQLGTVYTFGNNQYGQCGRNYVPPEQGQNMDGEEVEDDSEDDDSDDDVCPPGEHDWSVSRCVVCKFCKFCTGYGPTCCNEGMPGREPGNDCGCGSGDAGCTVCGACKVCVGESDSWGGGMTFHDMESVEPELYEVIVRTRGGQKKDKEGGDKEKEKKSKKKKDKNKDDGNGGGMGLQLLFGGKGDSVEKDNEKSELVDGAKKGGDEKVSTKKPGLLLLPDDNTVMQVACGMSHTVVLLHNGEVYAFGNNAHGQLGQGNLKPCGHPVKVPLPSPAQEIACGDAHTTVLLSTGEVYTFGKNQDGQLGREPVELDGDKDTWNTVPGVMEIPGESCRVKWIQTSGSQTFVAIDESLISETGLTQCRVFANSLCIGIVPAANGNGSRSSVIMVDTASLSASKIDDSDQANLSNSALCVDPEYSMLWSYNMARGTLSCYNPIASEVKDTAGTILVPPLCLPQSKEATISRQHAALNLLSCLHISTTRPAVSVDAIVGCKKMKSFTPEDFKVVNRFNSHGGGWGYNNESIEAVRFSCDQDILLGGFGLFGGPSQFIATVKVYELGDSPEPENMTNQIASGEDKGVTGGKAKCYRILLDKPVVLVADKWYIVHVKVVSDSGASSGAGSSGLQQITGPDKVTFKFKNCKFSNNGTDVASGQIPEILYRSPEFEQESGISIQMLDKKFSSTVTFNGLQAVQAILEWGWDRCLSHQSDDQMKLVLKNSLGIISSHIKEVYPSKGVNRKAIPDSVDLAKAISSTLALIKRIFSTPRSHSGPAPSSNEQDIMAQCRETFTSCFHAFYPSSTLKWFALCHLLQSIDPSDIIVGFPGDNLLSAVLEALTLPDYSYIGLSFDAPMKLAHALDNSSDNSRFPFLTEFMHQKTKEEFFSGGRNGELMSFQAVAAKLLTLVSASLRMELSGETVPCANVVNKAGEFLVSRFNELTLCSAYPGIASYSGLTVTPSKRKEKVWETSCRFPSCEVGHPQPGNTDVSFSANSPVLLYGLGVYMYGGDSDHQYEYDVEILKDGKPTAEACGTLSSSACTGDSKIATITFSQPCKLEQNVVYVARVDIKGETYTIGTEGKKSVVGQGGVVITFHSTGLTESHPDTGLVAKFLCSSLISAPQTVVQLSVHMASMLLDLTVGFLTRILQAGPTPEALRALSSSYLMSKLLPNVLAQLGTIASQQPDSSVAVLDMVRRTLPVISAAVRGFNKVLDPDSNTPENEYIDSKLLHYANVETDHPYKPATVSHFRVKFPKKVKWLSLEFDSKCGFAQQEDKLVDILIPREERSNDNEDNEGSSTVTNMMGIGFEEMYANFQNFGLSVPAGLVLLPGNEVHLVVGTDTEYEKKDEKNHYGIKCKVIGYEWSDNAQQCLSLLEKELVTLGAMCSGALLSQDLNLPFADDLPVDSATSNGEKADMRIVQAAAQEVLFKHSVLLGRGLYADPPTVSSALKGEVATVVNSPEQQFLHDFIKSKPDSPGGRLARWLQPDRSVDPDASDIDITTHPKDMEVGKKIECTLKTKDQNGKTVFVKGMTVDVKCEWRGRAVEEHTSIEDGVDPVTGVNKPTYKRPFIATSLGSSNVYQTISMMMPYSDYCFEELRFHAPKVIGCIESMNTVSNDDGTYTVSWIPSIAGNYNIKICIDGSWAGESKTIEVLPKETPVPLEPLDGQEEQGKNEESSEEKVIVEVIKKKKFPLGKAPGLRIRQDPSMTAASIGIINPGAEFIYTEEVENSVGRWAKLSPVALEQFKCTKLQGYALAYSKDRDLTLLEEIESEEIKHVIGGTISFKKRKGGPGVFTVVHCGAAGHNVRSRPGMKGIPVGRLAKGTTVEVEEELENDDGVWLRLSPSSAKKYESDEAWTLVVHPSGRIFLSKENDTSYKAFEPPPNSLQASFPSAASVFGTQESSGTSAASIFGFNPSGMPKLSSEAASIFGSSKPTDGSPPVAPPLPSLKFGKMKLSFGESIGEKEKGGDKREGSLFSLGISDSQPLKQPDQNQPGKDGGDELSKTDSSSSILVVHTRQALSPAVAECQRAIFAAFLWQENLVHDAMAAASHLKLHPDITKETRLDMGKRERKTSQVSKKEDGEREEKKETEEEEAGNGEPDEEVATPIANLPPTINHLVTFWDEIAVKVIDSTNVPFQPPKVPSIADELQRLYDEEKKELEKLKKEKNKKGGGGGGAGGGGTTVCELCDQSFPDPVTYHMKEVHPGCRKHANGWGYNSRGTFCSGWAGNCGDGGRGGSTWYLMCKDCHAKYLQQKDESKKKAPKQMVLPKMKSRKPGKPRSLPALSTIQGMIQNAKFLIDISGDSDITKPKVSTPTFSRQVSTPDESKDKTSSLPRKSQEAPLPFKQKPPAFLRSASLATGVAPEPIKRIRSDSSEEVLEISPHFSRQTTVGPTSRVSESSSLVMKPSMALAKLMYQRSRKGMDSEDSGYGRVLGFVQQYHDLEGLRVSMKQAMRVSVLRSCALEFLEWLLIQVSVPAVIHDVLWHFMSAISNHPMITSANQAKEDQSDDDQQEEPTDWSLGTHPLTDLEGAGSSLVMLRKTFHSLLQTIANIMGKLPVGSSAQQMALKCWCLKFQPQDQSFLLHSRVFANISDTLSSMEETEGTQQKGNRLEALVDKMENILPVGKLKTSSNDAMSNSLTDGSTETFWESRDEGRAKPRCITITYNNPTSLFGACIHIDNQKDSGQRVEQVTLLAGPDEDNLKEADKCNIVPNHTGWKVLMVPPRDDYTILKFELRGSSNNVRARQVMVMGVPNKQLQGASLKTEVVMLKDCEAEALRLFRLLTSQVFGGLLNEAIKEGEDDTDSNGEGTEEEPSSMANILFNKSRLSGLQRSVCQHVMASVHTEAEKMKKEWETNLKDGPSGGSKVQLTSRQMSHEPSSGSEGKGKGTDTYCYELLTMLSGLSQSELGCTFLTEHEQLVKDLVSLLHTATTRIQLKICDLLRHILPYIKPKDFAIMTGVTVLPPLGYSAIAEAVNSAATINQLGLLDCFLAIISKALSVQVKAKGRGSNILQTLTGESAVSAVTLSCLKNPKTVSGEATVKAQRWYLQGTIGQDIAAEVMKLLREMTKGTLKGQWKDYAKSAIGQAVLHLTKIVEEARNADPGMYSHTLWLCLAALCVIDEEHAEALSSGQWLGQDGQPQHKPLCDNHDDGETKALILCDDCGNLCGECDRVLHYHKKRSNHQRQVFKEEEEAVKVDLHEGCGRIKLYWTMALADSRTLKGMVEFKDTIGGGGGKGACRFCGSASTPGLLSVGNICSDPECQDRAKSVCEKTLPCGHHCCGVKGEEKCLPCLHGCEEKEGSSDHPPLKQDADDMCMICYTEGLSCAPCVQLECGHVFHYHCCHNALTTRWSGPRITFRFMFCSICEKKPISHPHLKDITSPLIDLYDDVKRKCLLRLEYENKTKCEAVTSPSSKFYQKPQEYALWKYAYYVCFKCKKAYYGGEAHCAEAASDEYDPTELVCPACSHTGGQVQICPKHGTDFLEYKCRYCCSVAVYFCFGTTHFCNACHDDFQRVTSIPKSEFPMCPVGPRSKPLSGTECPLHVKHPPTGEEFALGCGVCRNAQTF